MEGLPGYDINGNITELEVYKKFGDCRIYEIDPDTICQFTGLNDNTKWKSLNEQEKESFLSKWNYKESRKNTPEDWNGRKIWENDIVKFDKSSNYPIVWNEEYCTFGSCYYSDFDHLSKYRNTEMEVVGNIFDNGELLEAE